MDILHISIFGKLSIVSYIFWLGKISNKFYNYFWFLVSFETCVEKKMCWIIMEELNNCNHVHICNCVSINYNDAAKIETCYNKISLL